MKKHKRPHLFGFINRFGINSTCVGVIFQTLDNKPFIVYPEGISDLEGDLDHYYKLDSEPERFTPASKFSSLKIFYEKGVIGYVDHFGKVHLTTHRSLRSLLKCDIPGVDDEDHRLVLIDILKKLEKDFG